MAPIPRASEKTATPVRNGVFASLREACFTTFIPEVRVGSLGEPEPTDAYWPRYLF